MMDDVRTVMWKEWRSLFRYKGGKMRIGLMLASPLGLTCYAAYQDGADWLSGFFAILISIIMAVMMSGVITPDAFAGERERHTLTTLLASRLPSNAVLVGKMLVALLSAWGATLALLTVGLIVVNVTHWDGFQFYTGKVLAIVFIVGTLVAVGTAAGGVTISMRASTSQEAAQILLGGLMVFPMIGGVALMALLRSNKELADRILDFFSTLGSPMGLLGLAIVLIAIDVLLLRLAVRRFQRTRLASS